MKRTSLGFVAVALALAIGGYAALAPRPPATDGASAEPRALVGEAGGVAPDTDAAADAPPVARRAPDVRSASGRLPPASGPTGGGRAVTMGGRPSGATGAAHSVSGALRDGGTAAGGTDSRTGIAPLPAAERAERLPERARQRQGEAGGDALDAMDEMPAGDTVEGEEADPDVLLSVPLKGDVVPEAGTPALTSEGLVVKDGEVEFTDAGMVTFPAGGNFSGDAGTVAFEISPNWAGSDAGDHALVQVAEGIHVWENRFAVVKNVDLLRFFMVDSDGVERNVSVPIRDWEPGQPHRVAASWGDALMSLYVDGQLVGQTTFQGTLVIPDSSPIYVGYNDPANGHAGVGGRLTDLKIYGRAFGEGDLGGP